MDTITKRDRIQCQKYTSGTAAQKESYLKLLEIWEHVSEPVADLGWPKSWIVTVKNNGSKSQLDGDYEMIIGIEPDGYTHS